MTKLELVVSLKQGKNKEFKRRLQDLGEKLGQLCTDFLFDESNFVQTISISFRWESEVQMYQALRGKEYEMLCGAINSFCEKTSVRLDV